MLDGTADMSPEYRLNCFNIVDCSAFNRDLSKLKLNIIDLNTSKTKLTTAGLKTDKYIDMIIKYIKAEPEHYKSLFTYQAIENKFKDHFTTAHFGNIKGSNAFRNERNIVQVGLSVLPHVLYFLLAAEIIRYNNHSDLTNIISDYNTVDDIMHRFILADIEQNIFRGCIRNETNKKEMNYMLLCNYNSLSTLTDKTSPLKEVVDSTRMKKMIFDRYSKLGAAVNFFETPIDFKLLKVQERKVQNGTTAQRIIDWIVTFPFGVEFGRKDIMNDLVINEKAFEKVRSNNGAVKALLLKYKIRQGVYKKQ